MRFLVAGVVVFVGALAGLLIAGHDTIAPSSDSDAGVSVWTGILAAAAAMVLIRLIPPKAPELVLPERRRNRDLWVLIGIAVAFPLLGYAAGASGVDESTVKTVMVLAKPVVFLLLPWLILRKLLIAPQGESVWRPRGGWRWLAAIPALLVYGYVMLLSPLAGPLPKAADVKDFTELVIIASITVLTANVLEELFYRVMLQTRLEQAIGRWPGIVVTSLLFALMHLPGHGQGNLALTLGAIVVAQGVFALFTGYLWSRYRNVWVIIAGHTIINTVPLLLME